MSQWQGQPGYQYPMQTGFPGNNQQFQQNPQFQQQNPQFGQPQFQQQVPQQQFQQQPPPQQLGGLMSQQTGYPVQQQQRLVPQATGFPGQGMLQAQQTGFPGGNFQQRAAPPPPPVPPIPSQFQTQSPGGNFLSAQPQQPSRFLSPSPAMGGMVPQPTGFSGARPLVPQATGFVDPRLQMMSSTFMPMNTSAPYNAGGAPILPSQPAGMDLQQSFQQHNENQRGTAAPRVPWALSKAEKKSYDNIFRAWDARNTGFISGATALEVFGQSGLSKDDLARIWTLADIEDRGKLNVAEFHVAMGLIYRKLNGNDIPETLPPELVPPSSRDLGNSVNFLKDILKNESASRSTSAIDGPVSRLKDRSFNSSSPSFDSGRDATIYKHSDAEPPGGFYQPRSRHVDRDTVRSRNEDNSPTADLADVKNMLANTAHMLDRAAEGSAEDEALDREMDDLKYRVKRLQEDLDYVSRGPRSVDKDQEKRRLEREMLSIMHEKLPEIERKIKDREARREREKRQWARDRDRANDRFGRYDGGKSEDERDRPYSRGGYDRDRDRDRERERERDRDYDDRSYRRRSPSRERDRGGYDERPRSPPTSRAAPPPPAAPAVNTLNNAPPPKPAASPAPNMKNMTPEERQAYAREQALRRIEARKAALGLVAPSSAPPADTSVEDRLQQDKKEAEEKARAAEREAEEREKARQERLAREKALKDERSAPATPVSPVKKAAPPPPKPRSAPAPPPPRVRTAAPPPPKPSPAPAVVPTPPAPAPPVPAPAVPEVDPEEEAFRAREEAIKKQREARAERLKQLEREEEEARLEEERYQARIQAMKNKSTPSPAPPPPVTAPRAPAPPTPPPPAIQTQKSPSPPPAPPPAQVASTNPFSKFINKDAAAASPAPVATNGSTNPWAAKPTSPAPPAFTPTRSPGPPPVKTPYNTAPSSAIADDWEDIEEKDDGDDSSDDEIGTSRGLRQQIAAKLFGSSMGSPAPPSPGGAAPSPPPPPTAPPAPPAPAAPAAPPPPAPGAPAPPPPPPASVASAPSGPGDISALMRSIQGGARLKSVKTVDKSGPAVSGRILGDNAPPEHINAVSRPPSPPSPPAPAPAILNIPESEPMASSLSNNSNRQSVDWYAGLAADAGTGSAAVQRMPSTVEEPEEYEAAPAPVPDIHVEEAVAPAADSLADIDKSTEFRVRTLYEFTGDGPDDLSFGMNLIIAANPSKTGGDWWYGKLSSNGKSGLFPHTYVERIKPVKATAIYTYNGTNPDELSFAEGDEISIVDQKGDEWWMAEQGGVVFIVPAAYLKVVEGTGAAVAMDNHAVTSPIDMQDQNLLEAARSKTSESPTKMTRNDTAGMLSPRSAIRHSGSTIAAEWHSDDDEESSESDTDYLSFEDSDSDDGYPETKLEREARAHERQLVLEAAGLIVKQDVKPPPRPARRPIRRTKSSNRRPAPAAPQRPSSIASAKDLPPIPVDHGAHLDDTFERFESFRQSQAHSRNRLSVSSADVFPVSPTTSTISQTPSRDSEGSRTYSSFMNFLGRNRTPVESEKKPMLVISAPILSTPGNGEDLSRASSPAFGSSWASLVDKTALEGIPTNERKRQEAIFEFIATEIAYVRDLQLIVEVFYASMVSLLDRKAITVVFANIEDILITNTTFMSLLEERQKECRLYIDKIGDILHSHISNMTVYMEYCVNQSAAIKVLQSLRDSKPELAAHLQRLREDPQVRNLDLSSFLLIPMQRITRYPLLIRQVLHYTESEEEKTEIQKALNIAEKILDRINETIRDVEGRETLRGISQNLWIGQGRLDLTAPTRHMGARRLLKEGTLVKAKSGRKLRAFLCSDILVLTDERLANLYRMPINLSEATVKDLPGARDDLGFQISLPYPRGGESISLKATSVRDCQVWMQAIETAAQKCQAAERLASKRLQTL